MRSSKSEKREFAGDISTGLVVPTRLRPTWMDQTYFLFSEELLAVVLLSTLSYSLKRMSRLEHSTELNQ